MEYVDTPEGTPEQQLRLLLQQISQQKQEKAPACSHKSSGNNDLFTSDEFRMYCYKVRRRAFGLIRQRVVPHGCVVGAVPTTGTPD